MPPKRHAVNQTQLDSLLASYNNQDDYFAVGRALGMSRRSINENIQRFMEENRTVEGKRGAAHPKWDNEMHDFLIQSIEEDPAVCVAVYIYTLP